MLYKCVCVCVFNISHKNKDNKKISSYIQIVYMVFFLRSYKLNENILGPLRK